MLDLKALLTKILQPTSCTQVTLPYTPSSNGLLIGLIRTSAQGRAYVTLNNATPNLMDGFQVLQGYFTGVTFVTKGNKVTVSRTYNVYQQLYYFIPIALGGVVKRLLSALTPERGWVAC